MPDCTRRARSLGSPAFYVLCPRLSRRLRKPGEFCFRLTLFVIVALGMTLIILTEGIDLSLGSVLGLAGVVMGLLLTGGWSLAIAIPAALGVGAAFGIVNGLLIHAFGVGLPSALFARAAGAAVGAVSSPHPARAATA